MKSLSLLSILFIAYTAFPKQDNVRVIFNLSAKGDCNNAIVKAAQIGNPLLEKIIFTRSILDDNCAHVNIAHGLEFVENNPSWSQNGFIKNRMQEMLQKQFDKEHLFKLFAIHEPRTPVAHKHYALSYEGERQDGLIKQAWYYATFNAQEQAEFIKKYAQLLSYKDYLQRAKCLFFDNRPDEIKNLLPLLNDIDRKTFRTQIAMMENGADVDKIFSSLSKKERLEPGALYLYLNAQMVKKLPDATSQELALAMHIPNEQSPEASNKWWPVRSYYIREMIKFHKYGDAYKLASHHNCSDRLSITQAEWISGWIALRKFHKPQMALAHFKHLHKNCSRPISLARGAYWIGRTYKDLHNKSEANKWFKNASEYSHTFYGQLSQRELGCKTLQLKPSVVLSSKARANLAKHEGPKIIDLLIQYDQNHLAMAYLKNLFSLSKDPQYIAYCMELIRDVKDHSFRINAAREAAFYGVMRWDYSFPVPFVFKKRLIEDALVYSIIRQESSFDPNAIDVQDGRGLMQVLPSTAAKVAKSLGIECNIEKLFSDPHYNMLLGSKHLADHVEYYKGSYVLGIPAYNAGTHRVDRWIKLYGDPREMKNLYQVVDWIEQVPFGTTRDYIHRILENLQVYRHVTKKAAPLDLVKDLSRANNKKFIGK